MKIHELIITSNECFLLDEDLKPFELVKNDRDYQVGDLINYKVRFTNREINLKDVWQITSILKEVPGLSDGYCILGIKKLS